MTLKQCTKEELIFIIKRILLKHVFGEEQRRSAIDFALLDVELQRNQKLLKEADNWAVIAKEKRDAYINLLNPYDGKPLLDIPTNIMKEANKLIKEAQFADKKWDECMRKVDKT